MDKIKSRKLWFFLMAFFVGCGMLLNGSITGDNWVDFSMWTLLGYAGGNVGEHFATRG